ncbi:MAG: hypothetical protein IPP57_18530 [Candidatus Obscuribacter sp.]|jgi:hypothetical protein|nr:hypothetical protein [Candidatus Obscuribacter sp.]MDQ5966892.1 hypothetical protein [Cyanobacteriota bacterium erpe_2018_sw_39hr_WHONDRS-SW48-000098_B_bin.30]MBK7841275.1 hypothetical protein [Candidatus Obscuribacter sp.]MBK9201453.1 hypothetical protein [Candidatus Obscuribacter sp.]MBK9619767.1 hypothetical protein [Candidatus Obscuribacter sp.]
MQFKLLGIIVLAAAAAVTSIDLKPGCKYRLGDLEEMKEENLPSHKEVLSMLFSTKV